MEGTAPSIAPNLTVVRAIATAVFAIALPLFLLTSGVRWTALGEGFYLDEFQKYRVGQVTGLAEQELRRVAQAFVAYFHSEPGPLDLTVEVRGAPQPLFNQREVEHMRDVQALMHRVFQVWFLSLVGLAVAAAAIAAVDLPSGGKALVRAAAIGGGVAVGTVGALGLAAAMDFRQLFLQFHMVSFANDLWLLDPTRDRLIQLFPQGYFFDAAIRIAVQTVALGALTLGASIVALRGMD